MSNNQLILIGIALAGLLLQLRSQAAAAPALGPGAPTGAAAIAALAQQTVARYGFNASPTMLTIIAYVESSGNAAVGVHGDGVSTGLMGVTQLAARDNAGRGNLAFGTSVPELLSAEASMYHAAAYLDFLRSYGGQTRGDDFVVRAYNAGPTGALHGGGSSYLAAFNRRRGELGL